MDSSPASVRRAWKRSRNRAVPCANLRRRSEEGRRHARSCAVRHQGEKIDHDRRLAGGQQAPGETEFAAEVYQEGFATEKAVGTGLHSKPSRVMVSMTPLMCAGCSRIVISASAEVVRVDRRGPIPTPAADDDHALHIGFLNGNTRSLKRTSSFKNPQTREEHNLFTPKG